MYNCAWSTEPLQRFLHAGLRVAREWVFQDVPVCRKTSRAPIGIVRSTVKLHTGAREHRERFP